MRQGRTISSRGSRPWQARDDGSVIKGGLEFLLTLLYFLLDYFAGDGA